ncbi:hypothetical protein FSP39_010778 [Pinctada imbricata]|uniref:Fibrinogen C-terminal domain-containing protein n=1 Tax=Pinctada imbricata TaxID=66713 RepID=A0AA89C820_PINIB|nr:hypothetical protein FSP39_010778 [Pinctada imbricata]
MRNDRSFTLLMFLTFFMNSSYCLPTKHLTQGIGGKDSLRYHNNMKFTTKDNDNDLNSKNCATSNDIGAWWYDSCDQCGLNGLYNETSSDKGIEWDGFPGGSIYMKFTQMMVRCE